MNNLSKLFNKKVAILGVGIEGLALSNFLIDKVAEITLCDKEKKEKLIRNDKDYSLQKLLDNQKIKTKFGTDYLSNLDNYDLIFRSPGISINIPEILAAKKREIEISSQIKLFFELCPCKIIGITGTKGKGTTASLIFEMINNNLKSINQDNKKVYLAGNIGYPAISLIPSLTKDDLVVLELSSFQLMDLTQSPHISVITNLLIDHMDYHKSVEEYREAKYNITIHQYNQDYLIINQNAEDEFEISRKTKAKTLLFSKTKKTDAYIEKTGNQHRVILKNFGEICRQDDIKLLGLHNLENIAAAVLVGKILNIDAKIMIDTIKKFNGLPHRLEKITTINGVEYINDSYATNPEPTIAAIEAIKGEKILILGGSSKNADFSNLIKKIISLKVKAVILIGYESKRINVLLNKYRYKGQVILGLRDMDQIVKKTIEISKPGDTVLLSPACASFDMFDNYKDRGEKFKKTVIKLSQNK